jgi:erythromycin esterase-like protein
VVARQANTMYQASLPPMTSEQFESRDRGMAQNLRWVVDRENRRKGGKGRVVASGFNAHVQRTVLRGSIRTMGVYLAEYLRVDGFEDGLRSVGLLFDQGGANAYHAVWTLPPDAQAASAPMQRGVIPFAIEAAPAGSADAALAKVDQPIFALNLGDAPKTGPVADWLNMPRSMHSIGMSHAQGLEATIQSELGHDAVRIHEAFDWVVFFKETTPTKLMP